MFLVGHSRKLIVQERFIVYAYEKQSQIANFNFVLSVRLT